MTNYKSLAVALLSLSASSYFTTNAFVNSPSVSFGVKQQSKLFSTEVEHEIDVRTGKRTGNSFLSEETKERGAKGNPIEKAKQAKDGTSAFVDVYEYAAKIRAGELTWKEVVKADLDTRIKYVGMLHRNKRTPGQFMMRLKVPNGIVNSDQMRFYADSVEKYGEEFGVVDITTRQNIQLRGVKIEDAPDIIDGFHARNQTSFQSALDNVRNMVGSPLAGIDDKELVDTRELCNAINDLVSLDPETGTRGNPRWGNLPRKFNIAISGSRDDYAHTHINDIGLQPVAHAETGVMGFNVVLGGYMSIKRVAESVDSKMWIPADRNSVVTLCEAILRIFRDEGDRKDRQKARLMWLVEKYGVDEFKAEVLKEMDSYNRGVTVDNTQPLDTSPFERRSLHGIHKQPQEGKCRVGVLVPSGRLSQSECRTIADMADKYSDGEIRLTVEQNIILPNVDESETANILAEPAFGPDSRFKINPGRIEGNVVTCTGAQFCSLAMIETKTNAEEVGKKLEELVTVDRDIRIHWTGCPNSCGQVQAADIGIMGAPARKMDPEKGKAVAVPGCKIFVGGTIGENGHLSLEPYVTGIPLDSEDLIPTLVDILKKEFGAKDAQPQEDVVVIDE
jgi:ferredoxin-nitrite reductase